jgi:hypothetical protein
MSLELGPIPQEDIKQPTLPSLVETLHDLQIHGISIDLMIGQDQVHVNPLPSKAIVEQIRRHYQELAFLLPGVCDGCDRWSIKRQESFWAARPHFCQACMTMALAYFDRTGRWPEATFEAPTSDRENDEAQPNPT